MNNIWIFLKYYLRYWRVYEHVSELQRDEEPFLRRSTPEQWRETEVDDTRQSYVHRETEMRHGSPWRTGILVSPINETNAKRS